jgi:16S rRNA (guanine527-N7)-methyltransferase
MALDFPVGHAARLAELTDLVARRAERLNLTAHRGGEAIARRLVLEALALGRALPEQCPASIADLGSGAGFPGLPLAILWPSCRVTLVEARERRHHFQREVIRSLALRNATAIRGRAEDLAATPHRIVVAQAIAEPELALRWMARWAAPEGWIVLPQSGEAVLPDIPPGIQWRETRRYTVPLDGPTRSLWIGALDPGSAV